MLYHVMIWPRSTEHQQLGELYGMNVTEDELKERFVEPHRRGLPITWDGRTLPAGDISKVTITKTKYPLVFKSYAKYEALKLGEEVTNDWITGPPGEAAASGDSLAAGQADPRRVMVVHGRNLGARDAMFRFLRSLGLAPTEWEQAVEATGMGAPHNLEAVRAAMDVAQAVVVVLTAEDQAGLLPGLAGSDDEILLRGQPRLNVILEAGLAMGIARATTIFAALGPTREASDFAGLNYVQLTNDPARRAALRSRLKTAGCAIDEAVTDWTTPAAGGDFEACVLPWQAHMPIAHEGADARDVQGEQARRLHAALQKVIGELTYDQKLIAKALDEEHYWDPDRQKLVSGEWHREYEFLAGETSVRDAYRATEEAHYQVDRINHVVEERKARGMNHLVVAGADTVDLSPIPVEADDQLGFGLKEIRTAIQALDEALERL